MSQKIIQQCTVGIIVETCFFGFFYFNKRLYVQMYLYCLQIVTVYGKIQNSIKLQIVMLV